MNAASLFDAPHFRADCLKPTPRTTRMCRHFLNGRCTWGAMCRFSHEPPVYQPGQALKIRVGDEGAMAPRMLPLNITPISAATTTASDATAPKSPQNQAKSPSRYSHNPYSVALVSFPNTPLATPERFHRAQPMMEHVDLVALSAFMLEKPSNAAGGNF